MKVPPLEMMVRLSEIIDSYGLDVWVWYPNLGRGFVREEDMAAELVERDEVFRRVKRIDHLFVPGGDPGDVSPGRIVPLARPGGGRAAQVSSPGRHLGFSARASEVTRSTVPLAAFYKHVNEKPRWLGGVAVWSLGSHAAA